MIVKFFAACNVDDEVVPQLVTVSSAALAPTHHKGVPLLLTSSVKRRGIIGGNLLFWLL